MGGCYANEGSMIVAPFTFTYRSKVTCISIVEDRRGSLFCRFFSSLFVLDCHIEVLVVLVVAATAAVGVNLVYAQATGHDHV